MLRELAGAGAGRGAELGLHAPTDQSRFDQSAELGLHALALAEAHGSRDPALLDAARARMRLPCMGLQRASAELACDGFV